MRQPGTTDHAADGGPPTVIFLRPIGSPLTVGLAGLGIASLVESGLALRWIPVAQTAQVGLVLLAVPFILQLLACFLSYLARDGASGAITGVLSTSWLALALIHIQTGSTTRSAALGMLLVGAGGAVVLSALAMAPTNALAGAIFATAALRFLLGGVHELGGGGAWQRAAGVVGLLVAGAVLYALPAFELEGKHRRAVLPTLRRGRGRLGGAAAAAQRAREAAQEPGVRETT